MAGGSPPTGLRIRREFVALSMQGGAFFQRNSKMTSLHGTERDAQSALAVTSADTFRSIIEFHMKSLVMSKGSSTWPSLC